MKKRLNILCAIILLVMGLMVVESSYYLLVGVKKSIEMTREYSEQLATNPQEADRSEIDLISNMVPLHVIPHAYKGYDKAQWLTDSVYNAKTGSYVPVMYSELYVSVESGTPAQHNGIVLLSLLSLSLSVWAIVLFIKWVLAVNRSDVFNWRNVRRLRLMGALLLLSTACLWLTSYWDVRIVSEVLSLEGYDFYTGISVSFPTLLLGLCSLIVAEVFAIGLRMKEEQDLTI